MWYQYLQPQQLGGRRIPMNSRSALNSLMRFYLKQTTNKQASKQLVQQAPKHDGLTIQSAVECLVFPFRIAWPTELKPAVIAHHHKKVQDNSSRMKL